MQFNTQETLPRTPENIGPKSVANTPGLFPADVAHSDAFDERTSDVSTSVIVSGAGSNHPTTAERHKANQKAAQAIGLPTFSEPHPEALETPVTGWKEIKG